MAEDLKKMYRTIVKDHFPPRMEIAFVDDDDQRQTLFYERVSWTIDGEAKGLRYGENPGQEAALYRLVNGNLALAGTQTLQAGRYLASDIELLQSGKHPGKTNLTDADLRQSSILGAVFDAEPSGELELGREGAHDRARVVHAAGDATGAELVRTLAAVRDAKEAA